MVAVNATSHARVPLTAPPTGASLATLSHRRGARPEIAGRPSTSTRAAASTSAHALAESDEDLPGWESATMSARGIALRATLREILRLDLSLGGKARSSQSSERPTVAVYSQQSASVT